MPEHSPEPWSASGSNIEDANGNDVCAFTGEWGETPLSPEDVRRIVACINSCVNVPTQDLESGAVKELLATLMAVPVSASRPSAWGLMLDGFLNEKRGMKDA